MPILHGKEVEQLPEDRDIIGKRLIFLRHCSDKTMERLAEEREIRDEAADRKELQVNVNEDISRELRRRDQVPCAGDNHCLRSGGMDSQRRCIRLGVAMSLPWVQWTRAYVQAHQRCAKIAFCRRKKARQTGLSKP